MLFLVTIILIYGVFIEGKLPDGMSVVEKMRMEITESGIPPATLFKTHLSESLRKLAVPSIILLLVNFILFNLLKLVL